MIDNITLGQYFPGKSIVHRLDPRIKIIIIILYIISLFLVDSFLPFFIFFIYILFVSIISKIPFKQILKGIKPLRFIIIITFVINLIMIKGEVILELGPLIVTKEGLYQSFFMISRLILLVLGTSILTLTTSPIMLTAGIEDILKPLKKVGIPASELAMMMTIALRFIPTLIEETDKIIKAQKARGADFESGNILKRAKNLVPLLVPLFINSFQRADDLAIAMESRDRKSVV